MRTTLLDGPLGTELLARGVPTPLPGWSAHALRDAPEVVSAIHADYAAAGAQVHTTNTFRTRPPVFGARWEEYARQAVRLARSAVPAAQRIAGSIAPLADNFRPDLSPADVDPAGARAEHRALARALADEGCDLLLVESFAHVAESLLAVEEAVATGLETWAAWTPGPSLDLLTPAEVAAAGREAVRRGARAVLVNCLPAAAVLEYLRPLADAALGDGVRLGAYANSGRADDADGWTSAPLEPAAYVELAREWRSAGATILGGCCGTGPAHIAALAAGLG